MYMIRIWGLQWIAQCTYNPDNCTCNPIKIYLSSVRMSREPVTISVYSLRSAKPVALSSRFWPQSGKTCKSYKSICDVLMSPKTVLQTEVNRQCICMQFSKWISSITENNTGCDGLVGYVKAAIETVRWQTLKKHTIRAQMILMYFLNAHWGSRPRLLAGAGWSRSIWEYSDMTIYCRGF